MRPRRKQVSSSTRTYRVIRQEEFTSEQLQILKRIRHQRSLEHLTAMLGKDRTFVDILTSDVGYA
jgi:hypothetical protein